MTPGYDRHSPSFMVSPWHRVFCALGYPELDLRTYEDGEHAIVQYLHKPIIPGLAQSQVVLAGLRNVDISEAFLKHWAERLDLTKRGIWADVDRTEKEHMRQMKEEERRSEDFATRMLDGVKRNPDLMNRIAKNGLKELDPRRMINHIPKYKLGKYGKDLKER